MSHRLLNMHFWRSAGEAEIQDALNEAADLNVRNSMMGWQPIHFAAHLSETRGIEMLLERGVNINSRNYIGFTPLHYAAANSSPAMVEFLLGRGANPRAKNLLRRTVFECAKGNEDLQGTKVYQRLEETSKEDDLFYSEHWRKLEGDVINENLGIDAAHEPQELPNEGAVKTLRLITKWRFEAQIRTMPTSRLLSIYGILIEDDDEDEEAGDE